MLEVQLILQKHDISTEPFLHNFLNFFHFQEFVLEIFGPLPMYWLFVVKVIVLSMLKGRCGGDLFGELGDFGEGG